jgi:hypothetical protein
MSEDGWNVWASAVSRAGKSNRRTSGACVECAASIRVSSILSQVEGSRVDARSGSAGIAFDDSVLALGEGFVNMIIGIGAGIPSLESS